jgi:hypothetical protein
MMTHDKLLFFTFFFDIAFTVNVIDVDFLLHLSPLHGGDASACVREGNFILGVFIVTAEFNEVASRAL